MDEERERGTSFHSLDSPKSPTSPTVLPWDRFSNWLHCACVVTFDLELGQAMELVYPGHIRMTEKELSYCKPSKTLLIKMNICYLSFPDSNSDHLVKRDGDLPCTGDVYHVFFPVEKTLTSCVFNMVITYMFNTFIGQVGCMGDTQFHFRIRQCPGRKPIVKSHVEYNKDCPIQLQSDSAYYYGFVFFRQTKDRSVRRGYFQKSVVLISKLPFIALFSELVSTIAPEYFDNGEPSLEAACHDIDQWPPPVPGETLNLPLFGTIIQVRVPSRSDKLLGQLPSKAPALPSIPAHTILPTIFETDIFSSFQTVLPHVQMLWELVLTGEPLVVMAASPTVTSNTVQSLVSLISPLKYCCDYRPYFTIHDSEFKEYTTRTQAPPPVILGVTNPFFAKTLQHWPHIVRIGEMCGDVTVPKGFNKLKKSTALKTLDSKPGVYTRYKAFLLKDKGILKRLIKGIQSKRPVEAQNAILRRYFLELTQSFMIPLERYMASLMPLQRNISPHKGPPSLRQFDQEEFLKSVDHSGPQLTSGIKGDWEGLYRRFFRSQNFEGWYYHRQYEVNQKLQVLHMEALCEANLMEWTADREEVEVVDLILRIREKLNFASSHHVPVSDDSVQKLRKQMGAIISSLPEDLQSVLKS